ncbi:MAG: VWA domain-containing protein [Myxococcota bacterium]|nr:VWA domain-containing protein [Myxococcota bacterium]
MPLFFSDSWVIWLGIPLLVIWIWAYLKKLGLLGKSEARSATIRYSSIAALKQLPKSKRFHIRQGLFLSRPLTLFFILLALARPQQGKEESLIKSEGIDIVLAMDTSGSMQALDLDSDRSLPKRRNRLQVAQKVVQSFVEQRPNDQLGLVVFGANAFTQCPLTLDHGIVTSFLDSLEIGMAGDGTAIGDAIATAVKRLQKSTAKSKVIVLLTDGRNNAGSISPRKAAEIAKTFGVKIYTIGAGKRGKAPFLVDGLFGKQPVYQEVDIDDDILNEIAGLTEGTYFRAEDKSALTKIYNQIDTLEKTEIESSTYMEYNEHFWFFLFPALLVFFLELVGLNTRYRKVP